MVIMTFYNYYNDYIVNPDPFEGFSYSLKDLTLNKHVLQSPQTLNMNMKIASDVRFLITLNVILKAICTLIIHQIFLLACDWSKHVTD